MSSEQPTIKILIGSTGQVTVVASSALTSKWLERKIFMPEDPTDGTIYAWDH